MGEKTGSVYFVKDEKGYYGARAERVTEKAMLIPIGKKKVWFPSQAVWAGAGGSVHHIDRWIIQKKLESGELTAADLKYLEAGEPPRHHR